MPTSETERMLAAGAERSRAATARAGSLGDPPRRSRLRETPGRLAAWFEAQPAPRRKLIIGIGLFLLFDLIAGLAAVTMGTHF